MTRTYLLWIGLLLLAAAAVRMPLLSIRPMHTDEAVHAVKFGHLLEEGRYEYDPLEYHGPTFHYISLAAARLFGKNAVAELTESFLRAVPAVFGTLLVLLPLLFWDGLGCRAAVFAAGLLAFSPAFVFYSRYYIHEIFLVFFLGLFLGCLWRYLKNPRPRWAFLTGLFAGLMFATKETCILAFASVVLSFLLAGGLLFLHTQKEFEKPRPLHFVNLCWGGAAFIGVWAVLFSAFGTHPQGLSESIRSYWLYFSHAQTMHIHIHPWWYYLDLLTWIEFIEPISWNEDGIVALSLLGFFVAILTRRDLQPFSLPRFLALFTLILTILYSAIPYKTPWNVLSFLFGMALLGGIAADQFLKHLSGTTERIALVSVLLVFGLLSPLIQSVLLNTKFAAAVSNPYVYGHTGKDIYTMSEKVKAIASALPEGRDLYIQVIASNNDYWPWPWYLRRFSQVGYWDHVDPEQPAAGLILAGAALEPEIAKRLYETPPPGRRHLYVPLFDSPVYLRPGVEWKGFLRKDLWDQAAGSGVNREENIEEQAKNQWMEPLREMKKQDSIRFSHEAMATVFEIWIRHDNPRYASKAARTAFEEADRLESLLSRYIPNSDMTRIARLKKGETAVVSPETMECLQTAQWVYEQTNGAFDITVGGLVELWKTQPPRPAQIQKTLQSVGMNRIRLHPDQMTVTVEADEMMVDLGGIGKGYAVDQMAGVLKEWKIENALIHAGSSSILAMCSPEAKTGWKIRLSSPGNPEKEMRTHEVFNGAMSCSGLRRGTDMIHPADGRPVQDKAAVWVRGDDSAVCDGLSTAFMVMSLEQIEQFSRSHPEIGALVLPKEDHEGEFFQFGEW